jgi:hypothetical protein
MHAGADSSVALPPGRERTEVALCGLVAVTLSAAVVLLVPRGGDLAAHLYRTSLVQHGVLVWDNLWFAGQYPLSSYSLLYYLLAAVVGNATLGIAGVALAAAIFASVVQREWRGAGCWPARAFAVLVAGQAFTAAYPYDMGLSMLLATLWTLQRRRFALAALCTLLTLGFSPLAFVFLALTLVALGLRFRRVNRRVLVVIAAVVGAGGLQFAVLVVLPTPGLFYPYGAWRLAAGLLIAGLGAALALRGRGGWSLATIFLVWAAATVAAYLVPSPVGHNLIRASVFVVPLVLVAGALAGFRPRWLAVSTTVAALAATVLPYAAMIPTRSTSVDSRGSFWRPVIAFLHTHSGPGFRVEVVPTANHWEAYYFPGAGLALARGWYRQLDIADNPVLYAPRLTAAAYRAWLRERAVRYVVVPHLRLEATDAHREAALVRSKTTGLRRVLNVAAATIFELPDPRPLLTGPGAAAVTAIGSSEIDGWVARPGSYLLRVNFTPYWSVGYGSVCVARAGRAMTRLEAARPGPFAIRALETPSRVVAAIFDEAPADCPPGRT